MNHFTNSDSTEQFIYQYVQKVPVLHFLKSKGAFHWCICAEKIKQCCLLVTQLVIAMSHWNVYFQSTRHTLEKHPFSIWTRLLLVLSSQVCTHCCTTLTNLQRPFAYTSGNKRQQCRATGCHHNPISGAIVYCSAFHFISMQFSTVTAVFNKTKYWMTSIYEKLKDKEGAVKIEKIPR